MARYSVMIIVLLAIVGLVSADQICIKTKSDGMTKYGGTNCPLQVIAFVTNVGYKAAFIDKYARDSWVEADIEDQYGKKRKSLAYVSKQRVHEHTDSCFEMQSGFGTVDLERDIEISFVDKNCNDALFIEQVFLPRRGKVWSLSGNQGWCMNGRKYLENDFEFKNDGSGVTFDDGCARELHFEPSGDVTFEEWGTTVGVGSRGSGRRVLREVEPFQDYRFIGLAESERREISLIEALYDVCENFDLGEDFDSTDRYEHETEQIVRRCYDMLSHFQGTYQEFESKEKKAILPAEHRPSTDEKVLAADRLPLSEDTRESSEDSETSESNSKNRLMRVQEILKETMPKIPSLP